jgi:NADP-dependent 3-hydroxy acid dehydrogenase YdfG
MAFYGKVALITGGASGLGKAMTVRLAKQGAKVAILDWDETGLARTTALSANIIPFAGDVTNVAQIREIVATVEHDIGPIDRCVHCAAIMPGGMLHETAPDQIHHVMAVNYGGTVNVTQTVVPYMQQRDQGDMIVFGSIAGIIPTTKFGAYGATKAATNYYMMVLMEESKATRIRFQLVCPSAVNTPLIDQAVAKGPRFLREMQQTGKDIATPEAVLDAVENALEHGKQVTYPGVANQLRFGYRLFPALLTRLIAKRC